MIQTNEISLVPYRTLDADRLNPSVAEIKAIEHRFPGVDNGYLLAAMYAAIDQQVSTSTDPGIALLRDVVIRIYELSSRFHEEQDSSLRMPLDTLRNFIVNGEVDPFYAAKPDFTFTVGELIQVLVGAGEIVDGVPQRPIETFILEVTPDTFTGPCTTLITTNVPPAVKSLFTTNEITYFLPFTFDLLPGTRLEVVAYIDSPAVTCDPAADALEVISADVVRIPEVMAENSDSDLLPDGWEHFYFGDLSIANGLSDFDADGFSDLYEYMHGTDSAAFTPGPAAAHWWMTRGVIDTNQTPNDLAAAVVGQLKHVAYQAYLEMETNFPGGAGLAISNLVQNFLVTSNDLEAINLVQLKHAGQLYYDRLAEVGLVNHGAYPWTFTSTQDDEDFAVATLGQLKFVFSFIIPLLDPPPTAPASGMAAPPPPAPELFFPEIPAGPEPGTGSGSASSPVSGASIDSDGDGLSDRQEIERLGSDPHDADSDNDGMADGYEAEHGLDILGDDADVDLDQDGQSNFDEYQYGSDPRDAQSQGTPPLPGAVSSTSPHPHTPTLPHPHTLTLPPAFTNIEFLILYELPGAAATNEVGDWTRRSTVIQGRFGRGIAEYVFTTAADDLYRLEIEGQAFTGLPQTYRLGVYLDDAYLGLLELESANAQPGFAHGMTPWLPAGEHTVRIYWDNASRNQDLQINSAAWFRDPRRMIVGMSTCRYRRPVPAYSASPIRTAAWRNFLSANGNPRICWKRMT